MTTFSNFSTATLPGGVAEAALSAGLPSSSVSSFVEAMVSGTGSVTDIPGVTGQIVAAATAAVADVSARAFRYVWIINMAAAVAAAVSCFFLHPVGDRMTTHVESALEESQLRAKQMNLQK